MSEVLWTEKGNPKNSKAAGPSGCRTMRGEVRPGSRKKGVQRYWRACKQDVEPNNVLQTSPDRFEDVENRFISR